MPDHDMNVGNDSGANVRTDLNDALSALVQNFSTATTPPTTFAHQIYADTSPVGYSIFKVRDAANAVWATLFDDEGRWKGIDGTAAEPSISFGNDVDNGFYRIGANSWAASVAGLAALKFGSGGETEVTHATLPKFIISEEDQAADEKKWQLSVSISNLNISPILDAGGAGSGGLEIRRGTGAAVDSYRFSTGAVVLAGTRSGPTTPDLVWNAGLLSSGIYEIGTNHMGIAVSGVKAWELDANKDVTQAGAHIYTPTTITTDTTPTTLGRHTIIIGAWTAANDITDFNNASEGQELKIIGGDANCNVVDGAPIQLVGGVTWNAAAGAILDLVSIAGVWYETNRSDAS
ncbi:hypothetical protein LCGC14_1743210 [marine sediment metagenome]|uniref:Uncharacterized protein n=1 Tax=marine sediment metagenome TaxID=412755 RepID=A0A0F9H605_9ZZZZ